MKKTLKKISALVLALAMIIAMSATVFAANTDGTVGTVNAWDGIESEDNTIGIAKQIVFINGETTDVREPNITYTYTIATTTPGTATSTATVTDHNDITGTVKPGPITAVGSATATVTFADTNTAEANTNGTGTADIKYANFTFTPALFGAAGIYRYKISEEANPAKASVGITEVATYVNTRYLDVYVSKTSNTDPTLKIYGYVLFEGTETTSIDSDDTSMKSAGFVNKSETAGSQEDVDVYTTENIEISKTITGVMADTSHNFPLAIALAAPSGVTAPKIDVAVTNGGEVNNTSSDTVGTYVTLGNLNGKVTNASTIKLSGLPVNSTVKITETNDTADSYKVKATSAIGSTAATDLIAEVTVAAGGTATHDTAVTASDKVTIAITNTLDAISPTGVVLRFGPYALMLGAGLALLILAMRRKSRKDED